MFQFRLAGYTVDYLFQVRSGGEKLLKAFTKSTSKSKGGTDREDVGDEIVKYGIGVINSDFK